MKRRWAAAGWIVSAVAGVAVGAVAAHEAVKDPEVPQSSERVVLYKVKKGSVGRTLTFSATATWPTVREVSSSADGTVTSVSLQPGALASVGSVLFTVDLHPVFVASGAVPSFRDLHRGDVGDDVAQLQTYLYSQGYDPGSVDGEFGPATAAAVKAWHVAWGLPEMSRVKAGELVYLPQLPVRLALAEGVGVGSKISAGEPAIVVLGAAPTFDVELEDQQAELVPTSGNVTVRGPGHAWAGRIASATHSATGTLLLSLTGPRGGSLCGADCGVVPVGEGQLYPVEMVVVPRRTGPRIPVAAIATSASGKTTVTLEDGTRVPVKILAAADGRAVVKGINVGDRIRMFG